MALDAALLDIVAARESMMSLIDCSAGFHTIGRSGLYWSRASVARWSGVARVRETDQENGLIYTRRRDELMERAPPARDR